MVSSTLTTIQYSKHILYVSVVGLNDLTNEKKTVQSGVFYFLFLKKKLGALLLCVNGS